MARDPTTMSPSIPRLPYAGKDWAVSIRQTLTVAKWQFRCYVSSLRFAFAMGLIGGVGGLVSIVTYGYRTDIASQPAGFYGTLWGNGAVYVVVLVAVIFGADAVSSDFQERTGLFLLGNPVSRTSVYAGKSIAVFLAAAVPTLLYATIVTGNGVAYFGVESGLSEVLGQSIVLGFLALLALTSTLLLLSSLFSSATYSTAVGAVLFLAALPTLDNYVLPLTGVEPWFSLPYALGILANVFSTPYPPHRTPMHFWNGQTVAAFSPTLEEGLAIMAGYFLLASLGGLLLYRRKELL